MRDITILPGQSALLVIIAGLRAPGGAIEFGIMTVFFMIQRPVITVNIIQRKQTYFHRLPIDQIRCFCLKRRQLIIFRILINLPRPMLFSGIFPLNNPCGKCVLRFPHTGFHFLKCKSVTTGSFLQIFVIVFIITDSAAPSFLRIEI